MGPYIILIIFVFVWRIITVTSSNRNKCDIYFLTGIFIYLYFFCVLRSFDVGRDIPGYIQEYNNAALMAWSDWNMAHFEVGYIFLMKVCNIIGLSARGFFYVVYFIILFPIWYLLKTESPRPLISVLVFICFQFFVFDLTGLRQAMASSLCVIAYIMAKKSGKKNILYFAALVVGAYLIHKSALVFALTYLFVRLSLNMRTIIIFMLIALGCFILNEAGVGAILDYFGSKHYEYSTDENQHLGATLIFIILFAILGIILYFGSNLNPRAKETVKTFTIMIMAGICGMLLANGSILLRATMYFYFPIMLIPAYLGNNAIGGLGRFIKISLILVLLFHFFNSELNSFDVTPYKLGSEQYLFNT